MGIARRLRHLTVLGLAVSLVATPLTGSLLLSLALIMGGVLVARDGAADMLAADARAADGDVVFRHYL